MQTIQNVLFYSLTKIKFLNMLYSLVLKNVLEIMLFFKFGVNVKFWQWSFDRFLCLLVFGMKIAKQLGILFNN